MLSAVNPVSQNNNSVNFQSRHLYQPKLNNKVINKEINKNMQKFYDITAESFKKDSPIGLDKIAELFDKTKKYLPENLAEIAESFKKSYDETLEKVFGSFEKVDTDTPEIKAVLEEIDNYFKSHEFKFPIQGGELGRGLEK